MKILRLTAENIKRLSAVEIAPNGAPVQVVGGPNEAGKSSLLDAIEMALGGEKRIPPEPIRRGQKKASVIIDLGEFVVTRRFTPSGTSLVVTNREGAKYPSPQALLDGLVGKLTFDPLAFATMKPEQQDHTLRALAKVDTSDLELAAKQAFDERTLVNREIKQLDGALATMPTHADVGTEPRSFDALTAQLDAADQLAQAEANAEREAALADQALQRAIARSDEAAALVDRLRRELEQAEGDAEAAEMAVAVAQDTYQAKAAAHIAAADAVPDRAGLRAQIATIEAHNQKAAENRQRAAHAQTLAERKAAADALTTRIAQIDAEKAERLAAATFPLDGLGLDEHGVTWNGLPFAQASTAVRTRVSVAIGAALNPKLRIALIRNGNDLDSTNLALIAAAAAEHDMQLWIERIDGAKGLPTVVIEDGTVVEQAVTA